MDGDVADARTLLELCRRHDAALMLDEAHALGTYGPEGRGVSAAAGVVPDVLVGTCGKALGVSGAFVASTAAVAELLWNRARSFVFSTALPPMLCAAIETAVGIVRNRDGDERRARLVENTRIVRAQLGRSDQGAVTPIVPIVVGDDALVMQHTATLLERGVFAQGIRPPTVPEGGSRLRVSVCSGHTSDDLRAAARLIAEVVGHAR
jgi:7-keto-8-aminopelargonate synthetase-like enzyme